MKESKEDKLSETDNKVASKKRSRVFPLKCMNCGASISYEEAMGNCDLEICSYCNYMREKKKRELLNPSKL